ncbi:MAG: hypothetical protein ACKO14_09720 [Armatimonadota bacterium]
MSHSPSTQSRVTWYGAVRVSVKDPSGPAGAGYPGWSADAIFTHYITKRIEVRPAYFEVGAWHAFLTARNAGRYQVAIHVTQIGRPVRTLRIGDVNLSTVLPHGFIRRSKQDIQRFIHDDGTAYTPIGFNVAWQNKGEPSYATTLKQMADNGVNWTRVWACHWDGKNPWWPEQKTVRHDRDVLWQPALDRWTKIISDANRNSVGVQLVLFHHGQVTTEVNPNWKDHPWNVANGGWLKTPVEFFTDSEAIRRSKVWVREAVARFGHLPSIFAWELFNEVEWVDAARKAKRWDIVAKWHTQMARYIRSIDAYGHLITTSSATEQKALWDEMDIIEPHTYPANIGAAVSAMDVSIYRKPEMFGEFGPAGGSADNANTDLVDGIYAGLLSNHAGAAQYWYWDTVQKQNLYPVFKRARDIVETSRWWFHPKAKPVSIRVISQSKAPGDMDCTPAIGWGQSDVMDFVVPDDINSGALGKCSSYLQGRTNRKMQLQPITYRFTTTSPGNVVIAFDQISKSGAEIKVSLDGNTVLSKVWKAASADQKLDERITIAVSKGEHIVTLENTGADWAHIKSIVIPGVAPALQGRGLVDGHWGLFMMQGATDVSIDFAPGLPDANYTAKFWDLTLNAVSEQRITVSKGRVVDFTAPYRRCLMSVTI